MAEVTRTNGTIDVLTNNIQEQVTFLKIAISGLEPGVSDAGGDDTAMAADRGAGKAVEKVLFAIQQQANILLAQVDTDQISVCIQVAAGTDTWDGTNSETLAAHIEDLVQAVGNITSEDGSTTIAIGSATVTDNGFKLA